MRPAAGQVLHFSEDPTIEVFRPHVAATAQQPSPYVWAVGSERAPDYWFPRQCPRAMAWADPGTTEVRPLGPAKRVSHLFALHAEAGIQLRVLPNLHAFWDEAIVSTLEFSGIRLRNALPRPAAVD
ncbi:DUF6886 family protein [Kribbella sp. NPDC051770]|uniref:DUF6886 family protein n=1 Tax=Kribbella sp. NPDC051770 TaxID=3155413 RepID=UPI00342F885C